MSLTEKVAEAQALAKQVQEKFDSLHKDLRSVEDQIHDAFKQILQQAKTEAQFKTDELESFIKVFLKRPYGVVPKKEGEWYLWVPKIFPLNVGWFDREEGAYNVFIVNRYVDLVQPIPEELKQELDLRKPFDGIFVKGDQLLIEKPDQDSVKKVFARYKENLSTILDQGTIRIKPGKAFPLIAALIRDGILPFTPRQVEPADRVDRHMSMKLYDYQQEDLEKFFQYGHVGVFYPMGQGKTMNALEAMCQLKGRKLVLVPSATLQEQWVERIQQLTPLKPEEYEVVIYHASHIPRLMKEQWTLVVYDEMHTLPANTYIELAALPAKYRMFLTGTPFREDGRIDIIWAISGLPLRVDWNYFIQRGLIKKPSIEVRILQNTRAKFEDLDGLIRRPGKTMVFSDSLEYGKKIASDYGIPFIYGETKQRLDTIRHADKLVISRVGDLGVSIAKLQRVIEFDFLFGSRRQELQRLGRLFHSEYKGEHIILMTADEYSRYRKRLYGVYEKGFNIKITRGEGVPEDVTLLTQIRVRERTLKYAPKTAPTRTPLMVRDVTPTILLDERDQYSSELLLKVLEQAKQKNLPGLTIGQIDEVLESNRIKGVPQIGCKDAIRTLFDSRKINGRTREDGKRLYFV